MAEKIVQFRRSRETAADVDWSMIDREARTLVHMVTIVNSAIPGGDGGDVVKALCVELLRNGAGIINLQRDMRQYGYNASYDDGITKLARFSLNLLAAPQWDLVMHNALVVEFQRLVSTIIDVSERRTAARANNEDAAKMVATR